MISMSEPEITPAAQTNTRLIVLCITFLCVISVASGAYLLLKGFQSGELLAQMASSGLSGLVGFLGGRAASSAPTTPSGALAAEITNTNENRVPVTETK